MPPEFLDSPAMWNFLLVGLGSALGGMARHGASIAILKYFTHPFPLATFLVNVLGSFCIGVLAAAGASTLTTSEHWRLFLSTGFLGGFTTFSAFSLQSIQLLKAGQPALALIYIVASVATCLLGTWLAFAILK
jgi:fluoride exporter